MKSFACGWCATPIRVYTNACMRVNCPRCGASHHINGGLISPRMLPIDQGRQSPWILPNYRPLVPGVYECRFRDESRLLLDWNGAAWCHAGRIVDCSQLMGWRGSWE